MRLGRMIGQDIVWDGGKVFVPFSDGPTAWYHTEGLPKNVKQATVFPVYEVIPSYDDAKR